MDGQVGCVCGCDAATCGQRTASARLLAGELVIFLVPPKFDQNPLYRSICCLLGNYTIGNKLDIHSKRPQTREFHFDFRVLKFSETNGKWQKTLVFGILKPPWYSIPSFSRDTHTYNLLSNTTPVPSPTPTLIDSLSTEIDQCRCIQACKHVGGMPSGGTNNAAPHPQWKANVGCRDLPCHKRMMGTIRGRHSRHSCSTTTVARIVQARRHQDHKILFTTYCNSSSKAVLTAGVCMREKAVNERICRHRPCRQSSRARHMAGPNCTAGELRHLSVPLHVCANQCHSAPQDLVMLLSRQVGTHIKHKHRQQLDHRHPQPRVAITATARMRSTPTSPTMRVSSSGLRHGSVFLSHGRMTETMIHTAAGMKFTGRGLMDWAWCV
jgi:hypothetical protein